jgi:hypothetical protein
MKTKARPPRFQPWQIALIKNALALLVIIIVLLCFCHLSTTLFGDPNNHTTRRIHDIIACRIGRCTPY